MGFCVNCGEKVVDGAKFCQKCGISVVRDSERNENTRQQEFSGIIYKCPNCGEGLKSFISICPSCGFEFRGMKATSALKEFATKLEIIESRREYEKPGGLFKRAAQLQHISKTDEQKISLIKNYALPNTKEDILEFMILATTNIDLGIYSTTDTPSAGAKALTEAWNAKIKQVYTKAKNSLGTDSDFVRIQELYDSCNADIRKQKNKKVIKWVLLVGWIPLLYILLLSSLSILGTKNEKKELSRLDAIVVEVQDALNKGEYILALSMADSIDYQRNDVVMERKWDIQREYWLDKVLDEAGNNGVMLEYTPREDVDEANQDSSKKSPNGGFVDGFKEGAQPGLDTALQKIDDYFRVMNGESTETSSLQEGE